MIRPVLMLFCVVSTVLFCLDLPAQDARVYHYQFIRRSSRKAAAAAARPMEPHLKSRLAALFRWRDFAQLAEDDCALHEEETAAIELPEGGQLHLRRSAEKLDVSLYRDGRRCAGSLACLSLQGTQAGVTAGSSLCKKSIVRKPLPQAIKENSLTGDLGNVISYHHEKVFGSLSVARSRSFGSRRPGGAGAPDRPDLCRIRVLFIQ